MGQAGNFVVVGLLTLASGLLDARGFVYAARAWPQGQLDAKMGLAALLSFVGGLTAYILAIRFMQNAGVHQLVNGATGLKARVEGQPWVRPTQATPDLLVNGVVIVEAKAVRTIDPVHKAQVINYLKASDIEVGLLLNFGDTPQFQRLVFDNARKAERKPSQEVVEGDLPNADPRRGSV